MRFQRDAPFDELGSFAFQQSPLQGRVGFTNEDPAARAKYAVPGSAAAGRTRRHGASRGPRTAGKPERARKLAVGDHAAARDALHEAIDGIPRRKFLRHAAHIIRVRPRVRQLRGVRAAGDSPLLGSA